MNQQLLDATCLAHAVPGIMLRLETHAGATVLVSATCLQADLSPCRLRQAMLTDGIARELHRGVAEVIVQSGAVHLGGGIYQTSHPAETTHRWFVTSLSAEAVVRRFTDPDDESVADDRFGLVLRPDVDLNRTVVGVHSLDPSLDHEVDEVAANSVAACLTDELLADVSTVRSPS